MNRLKMGLFFAGNDYDVPLVLPPISNTKKIYFGFKKKNWWEN